MLPPPSIRSNFLSSRSSVLESQGRNLRHPFTCSFTFVQFATVLIKPYFSSSLIFFLTFSFSLSLSHFLFLSLTFSPSRLCRNEKRLGTTHSDNVLILCRTSFSPSPKLRVSTTQPDRIYLHTYCQGEG